MKFTERLLKQFMQDFDQVHIPKKILVGIAGDITEEICGKFAEGVLAEYFGEISRGITKEKNVKEPFGDRLSWRISSNKHPRGISEATMEEYLKKNPRKLSKGIPGRNY